MRLDAADLALLEIDAPKLGELASGIVLMLIARIRENEEYVESAERSLDLARDEAKDAAITLDYLRHYVSDTSDTCVKAEDYADDIETCLDRIRRL